MNLPKSVGGTLSLSGGPSKRLALHRAQQGTLALYGNLSISVYVKEPVRRTNSGLILLSGTVTRKVHYRRTLTGTVASSGISRLRLALHRTLIGTLSSSNILRTQHSFSVNPVGSFFPFGQVDTNVTRTLPGAGTTSVNGLLQCVVHKALSRSITLQGTQAVYYKKVPVSGQLLLSRTITKQVHKAISRPISFENSINIGHVFLGTLSFLDYASYINATDNIFGGLFLSGDLHIVRKKVLSGEITIEGESSMPSYLTKTLPLSGTLTTARMYFVNVERTLSLQGIFTVPTNVYPVTIVRRIKFMRVLTENVDYHTYLDASPLNLAANRDIILEQGVDFLRYYRWMKSDGIPFDLSHFTLEMVISPYRDSPETILCSPVQITITEMDDPGVFTIFIPALSTLRCSFTRAYYSIRAFWHLHNARLIEGTVTLSKGNFALTDLSVSGVVPLLGSARKDIQTTKTGALQTQASLTTSVDASQVPTGSLGIGGSLGTVVTRA